METKKLNEINQNKTNRFTLNNLNMEIFITNLKNHDLNTKKKQKALSIIFGCMFITYISAFVINPLLPFSEIQRIGFFLISIAFFLIFIILRKHHKGYSNIDYTFSFAVQIEKAKNKFKFWNKEMLILIPFIILIDSGISLFLYDLKYISGFQNLVICIFQLLFILIIVISLILAKKIWNKENRNILEEIIKIQDELNKNN